TTAGRSRRSSSWRGRASAPSAGRVGRSFNPSYLSVVATREGRVIELIAKQNRRAGTEAAQNAVLPLISVLVPVRNEAAFIRRTLDQLLAQDYDPQRYEVLVADGRSTDATPALVRELAAAHPQVRLLDNPKHWSSAGRNRAARAARGD